MSLSTASPGPSGSPCWFVGAVADGRDKTERFLSDGLWEHGFDIPAFCVAMVYEPC